MYYTSFEIIPMKYLVIDLKKNSVDEIVGDYDIVADNYFCRTDTVH